MKAPSLRFFPLLFAPLTALTAPGCEVYKHPPEIRIEGTDKDTLTDPAQPLVLRFSQPISPSTLKAKVVVSEKDIEGNLADEDPDPATELAPLYAHDAAGDTLGVGALSDNNQLFTITPTMPFPVGPKLLVLIEPGLLGENGADTTTRRYLPFSYKFVPKGDKGSGVVKTGTYFFLVNVKKPIETQIQLYVALRVDEEKGTFAGQFTNADRTPSDDTCPVPCKSSSYCRRLPEPKCVPQSEKAGTVDEWPDYIPNNEKPAGYSFTGEGNVEAQDDGSSTFRATSPFAAVSIPRVDIKEIELTCQFKKEADGSVRGAGAFTAKSVLFLNSDVGGGTGEFNAVFIPADKAPTGVPQPP